MGPPVWSSGPGDPGVVPAPPRDPIMSELRIVALAAGRGGSGKTPLTYAIGDVLHRLRGEPDVAIIDLDPQANLTSYAGHDPVEEPLTAPPVMVHGLSLYRGGRSLAES